MDITAMTNSRYERSDIWKGISQASLYETLYAIGSTDTKDQAYHVTHSGKEISCQRLLTVISTHTL